MKQLQAKLLKFRSEAVVIKKESENPFFKSKYADLPSILEEINKLLVKHGISIAHYTKFINDSLVLETVVCDIESGEQIESIFPIFGNKPQEVGSSMTYARRYNIQSLLDLSTDDDDGNSANSSTPIKAVKSTDKPWFNEPDLLALEEDINAGIVFSKSKLKSDYIFSKKMTEEITNLIFKYPSSFCN